MHIKTRPYPTLVMGRTDQPRYRLAGRFWTTSLDQRQGDPGWLPWTIRDGSSSSSIQRRRRLLVLPQTYWDCRMFLDPDCARSCASVCHESASVWFGFRCRLGGAAFPDWWWAASCWWTVLQSENAPTVCRLSVRIKIFCAILISIISEQRNGTKVKNKAFSLTLMLIAHVSSTFCFFHSVALVIFGCSLPQELLSVHISIVQPALPLTVEQHNNLLSSLRLAPWD